LKVYFHEEIYVSIQVAKMKIVVSHLLIRGYLLTTNSFTQAFNIEYHHWAHSMGL